MDEHPHGLALPAYNIDVVLNQGQMLPNGTITPLTTEVPEFAASIPGIFTFECTVPCGPGHDQMIGYLAVLPKSTQTSMEPPETSGVGLTVAIMASLLLLRARILGFIGGLILATKEKDLNTPA